MANKESIFLRVTLFSEGTCISLRKEYTLDEYKEVQFDFSNL